MRHLRQLHFVVLVLAVLSVSACRSTKSYYKISVFPDPAVQERLTPSGDAVTFDKNGIWGAVRPLTYQEFTRPASLNSEWNFPSPFQNLYDEYGMPIVLYLMIENRSEVAISFNPTASFSLFHRNKPLFPIQYDDLYQDIYLSRGGDAQLKLIRKLLLRSYMTLHPGESARGLLLFRRPEDQKRESEEVLFSVRRMYAGKEEFDFLIPFRLDMEKVSMPSP